MPLSKKKRSVVARVPDPCSRATIGFLDEEIGGNPVERHELVIGRRNHDQRIFHETLRHDVGVFRRAARDCEVRPLFEQRREHRIAIGGLKADANARVRFWCTR